MGEREAQGKASVYTGPILLTYDPRFDALDPTQLPSLGNPAQWVLKPAPALPKTLAATNEPLLRLRLTAQSGQAITLCDFASAGGAGNRYVSWLPIATGSVPAPFSRDNPLRAVYP